MRKKRAPVWLYPVALLAVLVFALVLRLTGIEWGLPSALHPEYSYHPDEAFTLVWSSWLVHGQIIAKHFIYGGTLYYTILNAFVHFARLLSEHLGGINLLANAILVGRYFMVFVALVSILLIFECGRLLYDRVTGLVAALLLAVTPAHVMWAQQVRPDEITMLFVLLAVYLAAWIMKGERIAPRKALLYLGAFAGVTVAFRFPLVVICIMPLVAFYLRWQRDAKLRVPLTGLALNLGLAAVAAFVVYAIVSPHTFFYWRAALEGLRVTYSYETSVYLDAVENGPLVYQHLVLALPQATGYAGYLLGIAGIAYAAWRRTEADKMLLAGIAIYASVLVLASWVVVRYSLPLVPLLALLAAHVLTDGVRRAPRAAARWGIVAVGAFAALWLVAASIAFVRVEAAPNVRDVTAEWIERNLPAGSRILMTRAYVGDDFFNPALTHRFQVEYLVLAEGNDGADLMRARHYDYVVIQEPMYANMERLAERMPLAYWRTFYTTLGQLGFSLEREFRVPVSFAGIDFSTTYRALDFVVVNPGMRVYARQRAGQR